MGLKPYPQAANTSPELIGIYLLLLRNVLKETLANIPNEQLLSSPPHTCNWFLAGHNPS